MKKYLDEILSKDQFVNIERSMGGEDFGHYQTIKPGVFIKVGVQNNEKIIPLHNSNFDIDERAIPFTVSAMSYILVKYFDDIKAN